MNSFGGDADEIAPASPMRALSVRQPWAWLLANGYKDVENRCWPTNHRGRFLIHAAGQPDRVYTARFAHLLDGITLPHEFDYGGVVGVATLVDCVSHSSSPWFCGPYAFVVTDARPVAFVPLSGRLNFFSVAHPGISLSAA